MSKEIELVAEPCKLGDKHWVDDVHPDLHFSRFSGIDLGALAALGAEHVLVDFDGTLALKGASEVDLETLEKMRSILNDNRFESLSIASETFRYLGGNFRDLGSRIRIFKLFEIGYNIGPEEFRALSGGEPVLRHETLYKTDPVFWRRIMYELGVLDAPNSAVMIGNTLDRDIQPAQKQGLKTVLVDNLVRRA